MAKWDSKEKIARATAEKTFAASQSVEQLAERHARKMERAAENIAGLVVKNGLIGAHKLETALQDPSIGENLTNALRGLPDPLHAEVFQMALYKAGMAPKPSNGQSSRPADGKRAGTSPSA